LVIQINTPIFNFQKFAVRVELSFLNCRIELVG